MLSHPQFDPNLIAIGPFTVKWYALAYVIGFISFLYLGNRQIKRGTAQIRTSQDLDTLFFYGVLGVILGGRLGYVCFYNAPYYLAHPVEILKVWEGGMSFHGGLIGVIIAMLIFARKKHYGFFAVADFVAPYVPIGLGLGRLGNFINGELWGRISAPDFWAAMGFPRANFIDARLVINLPEIYQQLYAQYRMLPRHPSQLYELVLEGTVLLLIMYLYTRKNRDTGKITAVFLVTYSIFRFIVEFSREPDIQLGLLSLDLSMGQWLSLPMFLAGVLIYIYADRKARKAREVVSPGRRH